MAGFLGYGGIFGSTPYGGIFGLLDHALTTAEDAFENSARIARDLDATQRSLQQRECLDAILLAHVHIVFQIGAALVVLLLRLHFFDAVQLTVR